MVLTISSSSEGAPTCVGSRQRCWRSQTFSVEEIFLKKQTYQNISQKIGQEEVNIGKLPFCQAKHTGYLLQKIR